ncbi:enoyl-CoA hydratase/isomerase family protein (plasmid) [Paraburkholderia strydomiana]
MTKLVSTTNDLLFDIEDGIAIIKLNRPDRMNAVNNNIRNNIISLLSACDASNDVRAVVLAGEGGRALSSGQDLEELALIGLDGVAEWQGSQKLLLDSFRKFSKPCVTAVEGVCVGLGFHMALCTDWRVAPESSTWGQPEVKVGLASIVGPYLMELHIGRTHNLQLSLMAELITGKRAFEIGLLTETCEAGTAFGAGIARARKLASLPRNATRLTKERFWKVTQQGFDDAFAAGVEAQVACFKKGEPQELIAAFLEKNQTSNR